MRFLEVVVALAIREFQHRRPKLTSRERRKINSRTHLYLFLGKHHAFCYAVVGYARNRWLNTLYGIVWETKYGRFTTLNIPKCEHFTLLVCPLRFLVISTLRRLRNVQNFKIYVLAFELFAMNATPARRVTPPWDVYMANCHPGWQGYPTWQTRQPALAGHPTYHVNVIKIKWEIIWKGGLPHLGGSPHLLGVPHFHVNWP